MREKSILRDSSMSSENDDLYPPPGWEYIRKFTGDKTPMVCVNCKKDVNGVYIDPQSSTRYCFDCWKEVKRARGERGGSNVVSMSVGGFDGHTYPIHPVSTPAGETTKALIVAATSADPAEAWKRYNEERDKVETIKGGLMKCCACKQLSNSGQRIGNDWVCAECLNEHDQETGGCVHIRLQPKGNAKAIDFFHYVMGAIDADWPFKNHEPEPTSPPVCKKCGGFIYLQPTMEVKDVKAVAKLCGVGKVKIKYWGEGSKCEGKA